LIDWFWVQVSWNWSLNFSSRQSKFWLFLSMCLFAVYIHGIAHFTFISFLFECLKICPEYQLKNLSFPMVFFYCNSLECCRFSKLLNHWTRSRLLGLCWHLLSMLLRWQKLLLELLLILYFPRGSLTPMEYNVTVRINQTRIIFLFVFWVNLIWGDLLLNIRVLQLLLNWEYFSIPNPWKNKIWKCVRACSHRSTFPIFLISQYIKNFFY